MGIVVKGTLLFLLVLVGCASKPVYQTHEFESEDLKTLLKDERRFEMKRANKITMPNKGKNHGEKN